MLGPYRVLALPTERGMLCSQLLGDVGADVIKIEPPGGAPARCIGPFYRDIPHPEGSLFWWAYNRDRRSRPGRVSLTARTASSFLLAKR